MHNLNDVARNESIQFQRIRMPNISYSMPTQRMLIRNESTPTDPLTSAVSEPALHLLNKTYLNFIGIAPNFKLNLFNFQISLFLVFKASARKETNETVIKNVIYLIIVNSKISFLEKKTHIDVSTTGLFIALFYIKIK